MKTTYLHRIKTTTCLVAAATVFTSLAFAGDPIQISNGKGPIVDDKWDSHRVDSHAPIGIMGDHTHEAGESMLSYRYMQMDMRRNYVGDSEIRPRQIVAPGGPFMIAPLNMQTEMQMLGGMYAPTDNLTLMFMLPHLSKSMDHLTRAGGKFTTKSDGIGDFEFGGLVKILDRNKQRAHLNLMVSAPTGSITEDGFVAPAGRVVRLPYPMQLGSGTWDLHPGVTYLAQAGDMSFGTQLRGTIHLGTNDEDYSLGNDITLSTWVAYRITDSLSTSLRISGTSWKNIDGNDDKIGGPVPTANTALQGGSAVDVFGGINYYFQNGALKGHRLAFEAGNRVYQNLDGPQLGMDWMFQLGWQKAF